jgi:hypothetical protein
MRIHTMTSRVGGQLVGLGEGVACGVVAVALVAGCVVALLVGMVLLEQPASASSAAVAMVAVVLRCMVVPGPCVVLFGQWAGRASCHASSGGVRGGSG